MHREDERNGPGESAIADAIRTLEAIVEDRAILADLDPEIRRRLMEAAGRVSRPDRAALRTMAKAMRRKDRDEVRRADEAVLDATGIRSLRRAPVFETPRILPPPPPAATEERELQGARKCYVCKAPFTRVHDFYDQMCGPCAELNWAKRNQTADLRGRVALVTGARVKIGYHAAIKLLRAGARVIVTTRFPRDAAARYAREEDYEVWGDRLEVHGLDLRHTPSVEAFCARMLRTQERLDFIVNNACQTVRRPAGFYRHLMDQESAGHDALPERARPLLAAWEEHRARTQAQTRAQTPAQRRDALSTGIGIDASREAGLVDPAALSQLPLLPEDRGDDLHLFPSGQLDADLQQVDLRDRNSWRLTLAEVPSVELLEVQLVNAVARSTAITRPTGTLTRTWRRPRST